MFIYRFIVVPISLFLLPLLAIFNKKVRAGLTLRTQRRVYPSFSARPIWIHASSGEFEYAKSLIREFKLKDPHIPIVVTYFSPTYAKNIADFAGVDLALPLPLDLAGPVTQFLKRMQPRILLLSRTDFWPELLTQTRRMNIPIHVFSYTQRDGQQMNLAAQSLARWRLSLVDHIHCVSDQDFENLRALKVTTPCSVSGDTRFDQVQFRLQNPRQVPMQIVPGATILVAGSVWPEDERVLFAATEGLLKDHRLRLILVPHEPSEIHLSHIKSHLNERGLNYSLFSQTPTWASQILLVDKVGYLAELYTLGDLAFIGGSFRSNVHSVMEALGVGLKTYVGPFHKNNREALIFQNILCVGISAVTVIHTAHQWSDSLSEILANQELSQVRQEITKQFTNHTGATKKLIAQLAQKS